LWLAASAAILALIIYNLSHSKEWQDFNWHRLWLSLTSARPGYLLAAVGMTFTSYLLRAIRWKFFLEPIKKASLWILFVGQILGFSSIYLIGRPGEFVRPAYIARKENVPIAPMAAIWLLERIYDTVFLVLMFGAALLLAPLDPVIGRAGSILVQLNVLGLLMLMAVVVMVPALVMFRLRAERATAWIVGLFGFLRPGARHHLAHFLRSFAEGLKVIHSAKDLLASIVISVVLWAVNGSDFMLVFRSLGGELAELSWLGAALTMFFAVLGLAVQLPGVGGGYQVATMYALTKLFSVGAEAATSAAILTWIIIALPCLALGMVLLVHEGLTFKKLEVIAEEERAAVEEEV
ncbi:MAG: lysylphosphatidylglycerol synthase transmembrane domain-containing protein, partial [Burkholderiales bacterium]